MQGMIRVLTDAVANQIAAGEVIQRPASLVKELVENSIDSGAGHIEVILKDAGRTLVQVVDDGCGMGELDARLCFERHATSKIIKAEDLFSIRTMGFRGEALASIAAVAQVELKTRQHDADAGTRVEIHASEILNQEPVGCAPGTSISVRNLFYNIPARRKFLKSNNTEIRYIITEFQRIALAHPDIRFHLIHNDTEIYHLPEAGMKERIVHIFGKAFNLNTVAVQTDTSLVRINGFVGKPETARKSSGEQFFFVNRRFMKHGYFHKAIMAAYERLIASDAIPAYFLYFDIDPARIDVNVHPTKTEIKFEDENSVFQILQASVREALGKFNVMPSLDFNQEGAIEIPLLRQATEIRMPEIRINPDYNPFDSGKSPGHIGNSHHAEPNPQNWEKLFSAPPQETEPQLSLNTTTRQPGWQIKNKYILVPVKSGLMIIHQARAYERIVYEELLQEVEGAGLVSQRSLFPVTVELNRLEMEMIESLIPSLNEFGFDIEPFGGNSLIVRALPDIIPDQNPTLLIEQLLEGLRTETLDLASSLHEPLARKLAGVAARQQYKVLDDAEINFITDRLFACQTPQHTPAGKTILTILQMDEIDKRFS